MPTPVGPVAPDPNDPDLWEEWYDGDDGDDGDVRPSGFPWPIRLVAVVILLGVTGLLVFAR